jgi:hypothetical protein
MSVDLADIKRKSVERRGALAEVITMMKRIKQPYLNATARLMLLHRKERETLAHLVQLRNPDYVSEHRAAEDLDRELEQLEMLIRSTRLALIRVKENCR